MAGTSKGWPYGAQLAPWPIATPGASSQGLLSNLFPRGGCEFSEVLVACGDLSGSGEPGAHKWLCCFTCIGSRNPMILWEAKALIFIQQRRKSRHREVE